MIIVFERYERDSFEFGTPLVTAHRIGRGPFTAPRAPLSLVAWPRVSRITILPSRPTDRDSLSTPSPGSTSTSSSSPGVRERWNGNAVCALSLLSSTCAFSGAVMRRSMTTLRSLVLCLLLDISVCRYCRVVSVLSVRLDERATFILSVRGVVPLKSLVRASPALHASFGASPALISPQLATSW